MSTPSIQTLITQAQQVLNLKSTNEIRATLAAVLANANVGTPLNPNLTTQQLWDEFYEIVRQPSDDIMSIVVDQMMRMVFSPPAPGGAGADKQVIFNDMGVLAGDTKFLWDKNANRLDVDGPVVITGDLTVDTSTLKVDATNDNVIVGATSAIGGGRFSVQADLSAKQGICVKNSAASYGASNNLIRFTNSSDASIGGITHPAVTSLGIWGVTETKFLLGGAAATAMTLNSSGNLAFPTGKGIDFSAVTGGTGTATGNVLNDYEEGTFTPRINFGNANVGMTGTFNGRYTKVGRAVTVSGIVALTAKGSSTGDATLAGLPFTSVNAVGEYTSVSLRLDRVSFLNVPCGYVAPNGTIVNLEQITTGGTVSPLTDANFINSSVLIWNFTYTV